MSSVANITVTSADVFLPEVWSRKSFKAAEFATEIADTVNRSFENEMKFGDVLHIPVISNMTANNKSADTAVSVEAVTETKTDVSINTHKYVAFRLERIVKVQANQNLMEQYTQKIGYPLQRAVDSGIAAIFDVLATTVGTLGVELTWDDYRTAWQKLREAGVGEGNLNGNVTWMLSPAAMAAAYGLDIFINKDYGAGDQVANAGKLKILGWPVRVSNLLESDAAGQHDCAVYHKDTFVLIQQGGINVESDRIIEHIADMVVADLIYGFAEVGHAPETAGGGSAVDTRGAYLKTV